MHGCHSDYIVTFYGAFLNENNDVIMCMEYMDVGYAWCPLRTVETLLTSDQQSSRPDLARVWTHPRRCLG